MARSPVCLEHTQGRKQDTQNTFSLLGFVATNTGSDLGGSCQASVRHPLEAGVVQAPVTSSPGRAAAGSRRSRLSGPSGPGQARLATQGGAAAGGRVVGPWGRGPRVWGWAASQGLGLRGSCDAVGWPKVAATWRFFSRPGRARPCWTNCSNCARGTDAGAGPGHGGSMVPGQARPGQEHSREEGVQLGATNDRV